MYSKSEDLLSNFDQAALAFVDSTYVEFSFSVKNVDRLKNENTFQLWIQKYVGKLKQRLEGKALEYISASRDLPTIDWFHKRLAYMIKRFIQDFLHRTETIQISSLN
ncbi:hypothetical protein [Chitinophaga sp. CF418]|uniref:hypothetical protein n=1 Tax=Chitinophaga sp. CF418 TaxID=1855287 RepID=UPI00091E39FC|nr:hypothetical protein [Chitinophaga sp. CF418]SHM71626.1 hypothetical protein SAMN05216311_10345 [Chitinophaga sp. CF418]